MDEADPTLDQCNDSIQPTTLDSTKNIHIEKDNNATITNNMTTEHQEHQEQQIRNRFPHSRHTHDSSQPIEQNPNDNNAESFSSSSSIHLYNKPSFPETTNCKITQPAIRQDKQDENCILNNSSTINSNNNGNGSNDSSSSSSSSNNRSNELDSTSTKPDKIPTKTTTTLETTNEKSELSTIPIQNTSKSNDDSGDNEFSCNICFDQTVGPVLTLCGHLFCWSCLGQWLERDSTCPVCKAGCDREKVIPVYGRGRNEEDPRLTSKIAGTRPTGQRPPAPQYNRHQNPMSLFFDWAGGGGANAPFFPSGGQGHQGAEIPNFHHNTNMGFYMNTGFIGFGPGLFRFNFGNISPYGGYSGGDGRISSRNPEMATFYNFLKRMVVYLLILGFLALIFMNY